MIRAVSGKRIKSFSSSSVKASDSCLAKWAPEYSKSWVIFTAFREKMLFHRTHEEIKVSWYIERRMCCISKPFLAEPNWFLYKLDGNLGFLCAFSFAFLYLFLLEKYFLATVLEKTGNLIMYVIFHLLTYLLMEFASSRTPPCWTWGEKAKG